MIGSRCCLALCLIMGGIASINVAQASVPSTITVANVRAIRHVMKQQQAAWNRGDVAAYMRGYKDAPDTTFVGSTVRRGYR